METTETTETKINPLLKAFHEQKLSKTNLDLMQAQRLVNLYRSLSCFPLEFSDQYNQMLLSASPEVCRMFSTIMGGGEVRNYFDFLQHQAHIQDDKTENKTGLQHGFLPSPEMDEADASDTPASQVQISRQEWEQMQQQQKELMAQTQTLMNALKNNSTPQKTIESASSPQSYSEIIDE